MTYASSDTAILLVDPYNDFLSEGGKAWPRVKDVAAKVDLLDHLRGVVSTARANGYRLFFVPHHRFEAGDLADWKNATPYQQSQVRMLLFEKGTWGAPFMTIFNHRKVKLLFKSIGARAASRTPTSTCNSGSVVSDGSC